MTSSHRKSTQTRVTEVDRRDLVKLGAVSAAAFLQGCRQRDEAFIVQPLTRSGMPGASIWRKQVCGECPAGCQALVRVVDREAKKLEGLPEGTVNRGGLCALGQSSVQGHYHPNRLTQPMVRTGERGVGLAAFAAVSWEQALERVAKSLAASTGTAIVARPDNGYVDALWRELATKIGSPPPTFLRPFDEAVELEAARIALGIDGLPVYDLAGSDLILSFGAPFLDRWRSPVHFAAALTEARAKRSRARLVQIEARQSMSGVAADLWLPARAGSEGLLARALAGHLLSKRPSGRGSDSGADHYRRLFSGQAPTLEQAAAACDLPLGKLEKLAAALVGADRPVVLVGGLAVAGASGLAAGVAAMALNLLLEKPEGGGGVFAPSDFPIESQGVAPQETSFARLASLVGGVASPKTDLLIVADSDPLFMAPGGWQLEQNLVDVESVVFLGSVMNDTAMFADVLLPAESDLERFHATRPSPSLGTPTLLLSKPTVDPIGDCRHPGDVALALGMLADGGAAVDPGSFAELAEERIVATLTAQMPDAATAKRAFRTALDEGTWQSASARRRRPPGPASEADLSRGALLESSVSEVVADPSDVPPTQRAEGTFLLLPVETVKATADGRGAERPWLQELPDIFSTVMWDSWVEVASADARGLGLESGHRVLVTSESGSAEVTAVISPSARPGTVAMPVGLGHKSRGLYLEGGGANVYQFLSGSVVEGTEVPALVDAWVTLSPLGAPDRNAATPIYGRGLHQRESLPAGWAPARENQHHESGHESDSEMDHGTEEAQ